jgi:type VI secretion system secreted protein VgrG
MLNTSRAFVLTTDDPEARGRVMISILGQPAETIWADVPQPYYTADPALGPELGDEVLVTFENGNLQCPFVIGRIRTRSGPAWRSGRIDQ